MTKLPFRIFHIDDNRLDRELIRDALEQENNQFVLTVATSRQEFEADLSSGNFDLVLTDFNILGFDGLQVIDAVREIDPLLPVIVVTGTGSEEIAVEAMKRGAYDYVIKKPHHIRRLPLTIQAAIERKMLLEQRAQSEKALRASEERLRAFANALPDLAFIMDEDGRYIQILHAPESLLYKPAEDLRGKLVSDVLPDNVAEQIINTIQRTIESGAIQSVEFQLELPAGLTWFEGRTSLMAGEADEKQLLVYVARDITHRKEMELNLRRERNLLRTLIDNIPDYIFVQDHNRHFTASNTAYSDLAGLSHQQIIGKSALDVFTTALAHQLHDDDEKVRQSREALVNEERLIIDLNGKSQWILMTKVPIYNDDEEIIGLVGIARDITSRKRVEEALRESEEHLRAVVSSTPVILFVLNKDGILTMLQGRGVNIFPTESQSFIGKSIFETMGDFIPDIQERFQLAMTGTETASIQSIGDIILDVRYSPLRDKAGEVSGIIGVATDITERLKAERLKLELEKEQEVIALKERFISIASHDFRMPLTIIKMSANMLDIYNDQITSEQRIAKLRQINTQVDIMVQLLDDVLTMSKANAGMLDFRPKRVELQSYCEGIWDNFNQMTEKTHRMEFDYNCDKNVISIDPNLVHYIIANLLSNAIKYSPVNGQVRFEIKCNDTHLILRVSDNGIGIPKLDQAQLFQPFHRATNIQGIDGTGLGLSIVKNYVEAHQGRIEVESDEGQGTTFTVFIPVDVDPQTK